MHLVHSHLWLPIRLFCLAHFYSCFKSPVQMSPPLSWRLPDFHKQNSSLLALYSYSTVNMSLYFTSSQGTVITVVSLSSQMKLWAPQRKRAHLYESVYHQALAWYKAHWMLKEYLWNEKETHYAFHCAFSPKSYDRSSVKNHWPSVWAIFFRISFRWHSVHHKYWVFVCLNIFLFLKDIFALNSNLHW